MPGARPRPGRRPAPRGPRRGAPRLRSGRAFRLMAHHDVVALTYRTATASQNALLALSHGVPVLATAVGTFPDQVRDGIDGLLVPPADRGALVAALRRLAEPGVVDRLRAEVRPPDLSGPWADCGGDRGPCRRARRGRARPPGRAARSGGARPGHRRRHPLPAGPGVDLAPSDIPERVRATDLLAVDVDARDAVDIARALGLPRPDVEAALVRAEALAVEVAPEQERAGVRPGDLRIDHEVGDVEREDAAPAVVAEAQAVADLALAEVAGDRRVRVAGLRVGQRRPGRRACSTPTPRAAAHDLRALLAPLQRELGVLRAADRRLRASRAPTGSRGSGRRRAAGP